MRISKLIKYIVIALTVCLGIIFLKNEYSSVLLKDANYGIPALIAKGNIESLYMGSSMFRQGLDIDELRSNGEDAYILAYNGNQPYLEYLILERLIDKGVRIDNLYLDMYAYSIVANPTLSDEKILLEMGIADKQRIYQTISKEHPIKEFWQMYVTANNELLLTWPINEKIVNNQFKLGGTLIHTNGADKTTLDTLGIPTDNTSVNDTQAEYLVKMLKLAQNNNINVCLVETPKYNSVMNDMGYQTIMDGYEQIAADTGTKTIRYAIDYEYDVDEASNYIDVIHLSSKGRTEFSRILYGCK